MLPSSRDCGTWEIPTRIQGDFSWRWKGGGGGGGGGGGRTIEKFYASASGLYARERSATLAGISHVSLSTESRRRKVISFLQLPRRWQAHTLRKLHFSLALSHVRGSVESRSSLL